MIEKVLLYYKKPDPAALVAKGLEIIHLCKYTNIVIARLPPENYTKILDDSKLISVEPDTDMALPEHEIDRIIKASSLTKAAILPKKHGQIFTWNIRRVLAGNRKSSGNNIKVGVMDTGIQLDHPDLAANIRKGINIIDPTKSPQDDNGHGTHIAGIIAAINNKIGVVGVADAAALYPIKVLDSKGSGSLINLIKGIEWAIENEIEILNISITGGQTVSKALSSTINYALKKGITIIAAAGNTGSQSGTGDTIQIPARIPSVIAVAALNQQNRRDSYSATGKKIDISAPGSKILSSYKGSRYAYLSGTSMAAAHVTGVLAIYRSLYPRANLKRLYNLLKQKAILLGKRKNPHTGWGLIQAR